MKPHQTYDAISLSLLDRLSHNTSNRAALGSQAMFYLQGKGIPQDLRKGRTGLLVAARSYDRMSAARLAIYYQKGKYGFNKDEEKAIFWRDRVTRWMVSDAELLYDDIHLKQLACDQLKRWESTYLRIWRIVPSQSSPIC